MASAQRRCSESVFIVTSEDHLFNLGFSRFLRTQFPSAALTVSPFASLKEPVSTTSWDQNVLFPSSPSLSPLKGQSLDKDHSVLRLVGVFSKIKIMTDMKLSKILKLIKAELRFNP